MYGAATPEEVSENLGAAFDQTAPNLTHKVSIIKRDYVGYRTSTVIFTVGKKTYRIVFSSDDQIVITFMKKEDLAAQRLLKTNQEQATSAMIVNLIHSKEFGKKAPAKLKPLLQV